MGAREDDDCVEWTGATTKAGYGKRCIKQKYYLVHRLAFEERYGYLPEVVRHKCDNPSCYNPDHLEPGTQADNVRDMIERGRSNRGQKHWASKLTPSQVEEIREAYASGETQPSIAARYNVSRGHVSNIVRKSTWKTTEKKTESIGQ
ncbi:MAG TPA: HNH endonuclease [Candidatus Paceibacterota bacterium]